MATAAITTAIPATVTATKAKPGTKAKSGNRVIPAIKSKSSLLTWGLILALIGLGIYLVYRYRFLIAGWFSSSNSTDGPSDQKTQELISGALNNSGGVNNPTPPNVTPKKPPYWPLKKGAKNEHVRWVQIMLNKVPNTGGRLVEDGNWGAKTDAKIAAAASYFGLKSLRVTENEFFSMMCKTWPGSNSCKRIKKDWVEQLISG